MPPHPFDAAGWITAAAILVLLALSAFMSWSETALTAASRVRLKAIADRGSPAAATALRLIDDGETMAGALLLGNTLANILAVALATALSFRLFGEAGVALAAVAGAAVILIFGEVLPKALAIADPERAAVRAAPPIALAVRVLTPGVAAVRLVVRGLLRVFGVRSNPEGRMLSMRQDIAGAIALGHSEGAVEKEDRDRLMGAFDLAERTVEEVMRHRSRIEMIDADRAPDEIITQALASPHTRLPVYRGDVENILGVIHSKELLREVDRLVRGETGNLAQLRDLDILKIAMKPYFVPETTPLDEQMRAFLKRRTHFALVVDEYGALRGLITLEDILEEIVGDITDEFDVVHKEAALRPTDSGDYLIDAAMTIRDLNRLMDWRLPDDEANTVAGLIIHEAQTIPAEGQVFSFHGFRFEVVTRRENRLTRLKVRPL